MSELVDKLETLFKEAGRAHHQATGGTNPDWAIWYANYLFDKIPATMGKEISLSELIYALMLLSKKQPAEAPEAKWPRYYAEYFAEHYAKS
jgi:hypothetical protein